MDDGKTETHALRNTILEINRQASIARPQDQYDEQKRLFLENAVSKTLWSVNVVLAIGDDPMSYRSLSAKPFKAQAKYASRENLLAGTAPSAKYRRSRWDSTAEKRVNYGGQQRYGRNSSEVGRIRSLSPYRGRVSFPQDRPSIVGKCYNCERSGCRLSSCPKGKDQAKIDANSATMQAYLNKLRNKGAKFINVTEAEDLMNENNEVMRALSIFSARAQVEEAEDGDTSQEEDRGEGADVRTNLVAAAIHHSTAGHRIPRSACQEARKIPTRILFNS